MSDARQERGQLLAQIEEKRIRQIEGSLWFCPSEKRGGYLVDAETGRCSCPDSQKGAKCKHFWAVEFVRAAMDGSLAVVHRARAMPRGDLTTEEQRNARSALRFLCIRCGGRAALERALHLGYGTLNNALCGRTVSASMAVRLARVAGVPIDDLLTGRFPVPGTCAHCGRGP